MAEASSSNFKWFGEGFEGFPRGLPEDCVEFTLSIIDSHLKDVEIRQKLRAVQSSATSLTKQLLKDYIWQRDTFHLELSQKDGSSYLCGKTQYGDSVEDEWLVVYILRELSKSHPNIWVRVVDTDGQFLLIEAANTLPKWLNPEVADFRVWINAGKLLIIPVEPRDPQKPRKIFTQQKFTLENAHEYIRQNPSKLLHSPLIEAEAFYRLEKYPQQIQDNLHHALITIPRKLVYVIRHKESYVSPAIEAFYLRDPIALRPLQTSKSGNLIFAPEDLITVAVKFTKVSYAQLKNQHFATPLAWTDILSCQSEGTIQSRIEIGMKLTSGFEMLLSDQQNKDKRQVREIQMLLEDLESGQDELPTDRVVRDWPQTQDDESWLDIDFDSFENELQGKRKERSLGHTNGLGNTGAQGNLRKIVERFEDFINDDKAGAEGAEVLDDMDYDDDDQESAEDEAEDQELSFNEEQFATMMMEMMGMPNPETETSKTVSAPAWNGEEEAPSAHRPPKPVANDSLALPEMVNVESSIPGQPQTDYSESDPDFSEDANIRRTMQTMEDELRSAGALRLYPEPSLEEVHTSGKVLDNHAETLEHEVTTGIIDSEDSDEEINIDLNLAKNMLESFKGQAGVAGPGGNLLGMMGVHVPRDEDSDASKRKDRKAVG